MTKSMRVSVDPYEIPEHLIPPGMIYQWVSKRSFGQIDKQFQTMRDAGWTEVPYERLASHFKGKYRSEVSGVLIGGQTLMERTREVSKIARDKEMDFASINANSGRAIGIDIVSKFNLSAFEIETARNMSLSSSQYAAWRIKQIQEGHDRSIIVGGINQDLMFAPAPKYMVPKRRWLGWLFKLISMETERDIYVG